MKQLNSGSIVSSSFQAGVLEKMHSQYLEHVPICDKKKAEKKKVYCGECFYYKYEEDDYSSYQGCKKIPRDWSKRMDEYYKILHCSYGNPQMMGDCEKINKNHDCREWRQPTQQESRIKHWNGVLNSCPIQGFIGAAAFLGIGLAVVSLISLVVTGSLFVWMSY